MINLVGLFVGLILGLAIGVWFESRFKKADGEIIVDDSDKAKTTWSLSLRSDIDNIPNKKRLVFVVKILS